MTFTVTDRRRKVFADWSTCHFARVYQHTSQQFADDRHLNVNYLTLTEETIRDRAKDLRRKENSRHVSQNSHLSFDLTIDI